MCRSEYRKFLAAQGSEYSPSPLQYGLPASAHLMLCLPTQQVMAIGDSPLDQQGQERHSGAQGQATAQEETQRKGAAGGLQIRAGASFLIVGLGASAGGLEAFKGFFTNLPADSGMAFVLIQHLSPDDTRSPSGISASRRSRVSVGKSCINLPSPSNLFGQPRPVGRQPWRRMPIRRCACAPTRHRDGRPEDRGRQRGNGRQVGEIADKVGPSVTKYIDQSVT
jgi:hypothetical protein